jgi:UTP-glucose-1-phosphate uridylyltransferase/mevalonate kinase
MKLFVPGRICLFGEHSDWAGGYRRINSTIEKGYTIITGTNQGIYSEVESHPSKLIVNSSLRSGSQKETFEINMDREELLDEAQKGDFYSYACGVAYQISTHYHVRGLIINNYLTDLPVQKGLSSSAAICVLVARAFNRIYDLKMTTRGEMEYAYAGEITTPSRCGRMDQGCAYGNRPILMVFDGDRIDIQELKVAKDLYFVIVDLKTGKDTKKILSKLNHCYPFADNKMEQEVQKYLGSINKHIVHKAVEALQGGDAERIGRLMNRAQEEFDRCLKPACPSELTAPVLHEVLNYSPIKPYILGGKGVGSGGDGSAQFIVKDKENQKKVINIIEQNLEMPCLPLVLSASSTIRKAVITAAGFGTRLFPASKTIKKELFPVIDETGKTKPAILAIVEEALNSGIEQIAIVVQARDKELFEDLFYALPYPENYNKLSKEDKEYCNAIMEVGRCVTLITQDIQEGFGHAVFCAREWVNDEPFLLLLGDHLYTSENERLCTRQLLDVYERFQTNIIGLKAIPKEDLKHFGCITGYYEEEDNIITITEFYEKPTLEYARAHLHIDGMENDQYLALFGQYILNPRIFFFLEENIKHNLREKGEFQLTSCLDLLRKDEGFKGYIVKGKSFDIGTPEKYRQTIISFRQHLD